MIREEKEKVEKREDALIIWALSGMIGQLLTSPQGIPPGVEIFSSSPLSQSFLIENLFRDQVSVMKLSGQLSVLLKYTVVIVDSSGTKR